MFKSVVIVSMLLLVVLTNSCQADSQAINDRMDQGGVVETSLTEEKDESSSINLVTSIKIGENPFFMTKNADNFDFPSYCTETVKDIVLVNSLDQKIVLINKSTGAVSSIEMLNKVLVEYESKFKGFISIVPHRNVYFIGFLRGIVCVSMDGKVISEIPLSENIDKFTVLGDDSIVIFSGYKKMYVSSKRDSKLSQYELGFNISETSILGDSIIYNENYGSLYYITYDKAMKGTNVESIDLKTLIPMKYPCLHGYSKSYLAWVDIERGNKIYLLNRKDLGQKQFSTLDLGDRVFVNNDAPIESKNGGVEIISSNDDNIVYVVSMKNKEIRIHKINLGIG